MVSSMKKKPGTHWMPGPMSSPVPVAERRAPQAAQHQGGLVELHLVALDLAGLYQGGEDGGDELRLAGGGRHGSAAVCRRVGNGVRRRRLGDLLDGAAVVFAFGHVDVV